MSESAAWPPYFEVVHDDGEAMEVVTREEYDRLREHLMRCGSLAVSERADGCVPARAAMRIRTLSHRACWPDDVDGKRHEITVLIGPCSDGEVEALMIAVADLPECRDVGGCVAAHPYEEVESDA